MRLSSVINGLGILGLIPFLGSVYWNTDPQSIFGLTPVKVFSTYSSVILTFLAGTLWANVIASRNSESLAPSSVNKTLSFVGQQENIAIAFALISNLFAIVCWVLLMLPDEFYAISLVAQLFAFIIIFCFEVGWFLITHKAYCDSYLILRCLLTVIVCSAHIAMILLN
ncbi:MAG: hypothetical protein ACJAWS_003013 [Oleiphilaceae bacterium]|jgi:hypothetical protein